jgi:uncharacterized protein with ParB-like and HNH nuclease domain/predicted transport protein
MQASDKAITAIIDGAKQFKIPVFQRDYCWTEPQCEQLWDDIVRSAETGRKHFLGSLVYIPTDTSPAFTRWLLIDGQQRLTTLTLLLAALRDHIRATDWKGNADDPTADQIEAYFLKNEKEKGDRRPKLVLRGHDQATLSALLDGDELPAEVSEPVRDNYDRFRDLVSGADPHLVYEGIGRLLVVDVTLTPGTDNPQLIFESLNSTGLSLSQSDLIRNFLLMRLPEPQQTQLYECYWSKIEALFRGSENTFDAFVRDYMALKKPASKQVKATALYEEFRRLFDDLVSQLGGLESLLSDILRCARYHAAFSIGGNTFPEVAVALGRLRQLVDVPAPLVMTLFDCYDRLKSLTSGSFNEALRLIESYVFRRAICVEQTRGYWQTFANLAYRIADDNAVGSLKVALYRLGESSRYPRDEDFRRELEERDIYGLRVCRFLLESLENEGSKEQTDTRSYSIEHILPQNKNLAPQWRKMLGTGWQDVQKTWLHRLGNLTLTGYNATYSDQPFEKKKNMPGGFADSAVRLNKFVRRQSRWNKAKIGRRGRLLAARSLEIWPALQVDVAAVEAAELAERQELAKKQDVGKVPMSLQAKELFELLRPRIREIAPDALELAEPKSVSYHGPAVFVEILPRKHGLILLLALDYSEVNDPDGVAEDATQWKFFVNAKYGGGVYLKITSHEAIEAAIPIVQQAYTLANS